MFIKSLLFTITCTFYKKYGVKYPCVSHLQIHQGEFPLDTKTQQPIGFFEGNMSNITMIIFYRA